MIQAKDSITHPTMFLEDLTTMGFKIFEEVPHGKFNTPKSILLHRDSIYLVREREDHKSVEIFLKNRRGVLQVNADIVNVKNWLNDEPDSPPIGEDNLG